MCGISFLYAESLGAEEGRRRIQKSLQALQHRGPDDSGVWQDNGVTIGHRRLSIIDLSGSRQPMTDETGRYVLTYNGEIYNYRELRNNLKDKWKFQTNGDTEVLLAGLILKGTSFLTLMEGMWAFALWDNTTRQLFLSRDRMGKKPLYYFEDGGMFSCASELPALSVLQTDKWEEDLDSSADFLRHGYYLPGTTAYKNVREVLPGNYLSWHPEGKCLQDSYWSLSLAPYAATKADACQELRNALVESVKKRLVADVEVGAFLSGGVDSSLVVSIVAGELGITPKTFTIGFQEASFDESKYAKRVAEHFSTDHHVRILEEWDQKKLIDLILNNIGQPFADSSILPTSLVSQVAAEKVKVALSGDGGDELFSGYQRYMARTIFRWYLRLPAPLRRGSEKIIRALPEPMAHHSRSILKKAHLFQDILDRLEYETPYTAPMLYSRDVFSELAPDLVSKGHTAPNLPEECNADDIMRMMTADALIYLPQDILLKVDRASMAHSLETRAPFLDTDVVKLAFSFPRSWHRRGMRGKRMLIDSCKDLLPDFVWNRHKQGFGVPIHDWFRGRLGNDLEDLMFNDNSAISNKTVATSLAEHRSGKRDNGYRLWSIYIYLLWKQNNLTTLS